MAQLGILNLGETMDKPEYDRPVIKEIRSTEMQGSASTQEVDLTKFPQEQLPSAEHAASMQALADQTVRIREVRPPQHLANLTLYEERAQVAVVAEGGRQITVQKRIIEEEVQVPVTLRREVLEITTAPQGGSVMLNGELLEEGKVYQITLTEERPVVGREVYPVEQIAIRKEWISEVHQHSITLGREVLDLSGAVELIREQTELEREQSQVQRLAISDDAALPKALPEAPLALPTPDDQQ